MFDKLELPQAMILEGLVTTTNQDGSVNLSPMGPLVDYAITRLRLRPFHTSTTYQNLARTRRGVFHVTDDVELVARAAIDSWDERPDYTLLLNERGQRLTNCCRWYAFEVDTIDDRQERTDIECHVGEQGFVREFFGFNRAKHAVLEAAILATRVHLLPASEISEHLERLKPLVEKTGGVAEHLAFGLLEEYTRSRQPW